MRSALVFVATASVTSAFGQAMKADEPIQSSRPSFSDTPQIVPVRHLQIESGLSAYSRGAGSEPYADFGEALLRYGLRPNLELRLGAPNYLTFPHRSPAGFDNTSVGASIYLGRFAGLDVGLIPTVEFPTGPRELRDDRVTPSYSLNVQRDLGGERSLGSTLAQTFGGESGHRGTQTMATLVYVQPLGKLTAFAEYAGTFNPGESPEEYAHFGLQRLLSKTTQVDLHGGFGLDAGPAHRFVGAGFSVRF